MRSACPPIFYPCKYLNFSRSTSDLDLMTRKAIFELEGTNEISDELLNEYADENSQKHQNMIDAICKAMGFDTLKYHRLDDLIEAIGIGECKLCTYCFNGKKE